jgi:replicative DNA helicase
MNAHELADELDRLHEKLYLHWDEDSPRLQNAATMLRQQALEIQALHQILGYEGVAVGQDYLDECVADLRKAQEK